MPRASGPFFLFCAPGLVFGGTEGVKSFFHVLRSRTSFRRYRGRRVSFSCFPLPDMFSEVPRASGPGLVLGCAEGVGSRFHVFRFRTCFRRYLGRRVLFSSFTLPDSFSAVPRASGPVFMFCTSGLIFGGIGGVRSLFHVLRSRTHFRRYRWSRVPFSCFARLDSFSVVSWASGLIFMFFAPGLVFGGTECVGSLFHVLLSGFVFGVTEGVVSRFHIMCSQTRFRWSRVRRVLFSYFVLPNSFSVVPSSSGPVFMFCPLGLDFDVTEGVGIRFHVLRSRTHFRRYRGRRVRFSCFARPDSFSAVSMVSGPVFMFCTLGLVFGGIEGVRSCFHVLRSLTRFRRYRVRRFPFFRLSAPDSFSTLPRASGPVFGGAECVGSRFHVLHA
jgi:hypothetical protein